MMSRLFILVLSVFLAIGCQKSNHPLIAKIGYPVEKKFEDSNHKRSLVILVYRKGGEENFFSRICQIVEETYNTNSRFSKGEIIDLRRVPTIKEIDPKYTENVISLFQITSEDMLSSILVLENSNFVVVYLVDGR